MGASVCCIGELAVFDHFAAAKQGPAAMLERRFADIGIVPMMLDRLPSPRQCSREFPARRDFARVKNARGPALLVDAGLELLGIGEMAPATLEREFLRRIPGCPHRRRIERPSLDVPATL